MNLVGRSRDRAKKLGSENKKMRKVPMTRDSGVSLQDLPDQRVIGIVLKSSYT